MAPNNSPQSWLWRKARTMVLVYYALMVEYRAELILWVLSNSLPFIMMGAWIEASQNGQFALGPTEFARYFLAAFLVRQLTVVWVVWEFERSVVEGRLSFRLLQPLDPIWYHVAEHVGERLARIPFTAVVVGLFFALYPTAFWLPGLGQVLLWLPIVALVFALRFLMQYSAGLLAFWTERASALEQVWFLLYLFLSGLLAPLEVFPPALREIVLLTPFPYLVHFPAALLVGLPVRWGEGCLVILVWLAGFYVLSRWLWRRGLRQYSGMGA
ncbi:MAG: ABC-2 family transporter protein [Cyanobacteria bacterium J06641_5]